MVPHRGSDKAGKVSVAGLGTNQACSSKMAGVAGIKPTLAELEAAVLSLHQTPELALPWRFERHPTGSQPACSLPSSVGSMVANARVDRAWQPYESHVLAGGISLLAAAFGIEPNSSGFKGPLDPRPAASNSSPKRFRSASSRVKAGDSSQ